ncbi:hypothetical protein Tco_1061006 [Tanacetum coccineum]
MDLETAHTTTTAKLPILKQENGNSFKPVAQTTTNAYGTSTSLIPGPVTFEEKAQKKNDVKARSMLLMALPNEHLMTFNQYKDAKTLFTAIQTRFGGNDATKKNQKTLLKQMYENFSALSIESLDSILTSFRRLNKPDLDVMSFDDLYNNFKIVEQEVKGTASSSSSLSSQNMAFVSSPSSTNKVNTAYRVSTANTQVSPASTQDLEQIHEDDIEEMDLKWQLALLSMRTRRTVNVEETSSKAMVAIDGAGFDWSYITDDEVPTNIALIESLDAPLVKKLMSDDKLENKTISPTVAKIEFVRPKQQEKPVRKPADCNYHQRERVVFENNYTRVKYNYSAKKTHPSAHRNMVPRAILMKTGLRSLNTARPVNTAHPKTTVYSARPMSRFSKSAQSTVNRPYQIRTTLTNKNFSQKVNTAKGKFYTTRPKAVNTARPNSAVVNVVRANQISRNLIEDMLPLGEELNDGKLLVLLKVPRKNNMYIVDMNNIVYECTDRILNSRTCYCDASRDRIIISSTPCHALIS